MVEMQTQEDNPKTTSKSLFKFIFKIYLITFVPCFILMSKPIVYNVQYIYQVIFIALLTLPFTLSITVFYTKYIHKRAAKLDIIKRRVEDREITTQLKHLRPTKKKEKKPKTEKETFNEKMKELGLD